MLTAIVVGTVLLVALVVTQLRTREPLLRLRLFGDRLFRSTNIVIFLGTAAFLGTLYLSALFFQDGLGLSPLNSGLSTFPEALGVMIGAQNATRVLYPRLGPRRIMAGGLLGVGATIALMTTVDGLDQMWRMRVLMFVLGLFMSHVFVPAQAAAFARISSEDTGRGSTLFNALRQLGGAVGVAVLTTALSAVGMVTATATGAEPNLAAYHTAFGVAAVLAVAAAFAALTIRDQDAESTRVPPNRSGGRRGAAAGRRRLEGLRPGPDLRPDGAYAVSVLRGLERGGDAAVGLPDGLGEVGELLEVLLPVRHLLLPARHVDGQDRAPGPPG